MTRLGPTIRAWRRALLALRTRPAFPDRGALLRFAWDRVPFWQARFAELGLARHALHDPDIWPTLPITTRADLQTHAGSMWATGVAPADLADAYSGCTSGSTGEPVRYRMSAAAYHSFLPVVDLALALHRVRRKPRPGRGGIALLDALGHSPTYGAWLPLFHGTRFEKITVTRPGWQDALRRLDPVVVTGDPDALGALLDTDARPGMVMSSAFAMPTDLGRDLRHHLRCPVIEYYSAQEVGPMAIEDPEGRWRVLTPYVFLETCPLPGGGQTLLVTDLRNPLMPLIRYAVGDLARIEHDIRGPLRAPIVADFTGRVGQRFIGPDGAAFDPGGLAPTLARLPLRQYRLAQSAPDAACLEYFAPRALTGAEVEAVSTRLGALAGMPVHLDVRRVDGPLRAPGVKPTPFVPLGAVLDSRAEGHRDAPVAGRPRRIYVALTNACNRACPWCSTYSSPQRSTFIDEPGFRAALPAEGPFELQLEGGEPTLHPRLFEFVEWARSTGRCQHLVLCTNGVRLPRGAESMARWLDRWPRPFTVKVSVNHHLIERDAGHLAGVQALVAAAADRPQVEVVVNLRRRPAAPDADAWVRDAVDSAGVLHLTNDFWLQRYGMAKDDPSLEPPYLAGTDFELFNPDGSAWGTDLVARSEAMGHLP